MKEINKNYCINSFLQFRFVFDKNKLFKENLIPNYYNVPETKYFIKNKDDMNNAIIDYFKKNVDDKTVLMLSGGMDSAILASYLPKNAMTFTLKCIADEPTIDETLSAKKYAEINGLKNEIIEITWDDYKKYINVLLDHKKAPFHSIEIQIYKAALKAKELGYTKLLFGESADVLFGGFSGLLSKDWTFEEFVERYNYVPIKKVLLKPEPVLKPYQDWYINSKMNVHGFISNYFYLEATNTYKNACDTAGITFLSPFNVMKLDTDLDIKRIRNGENKYIIRELFKDRYPNLTPNEKIPMPRPMELWLKDWQGPTRKEFRDNCIKELSGDAKWLVYILEKFLEYFNVGE